MKALEVRDLVKVYIRRKSREKLVAVNNISFDVRRGEIFALLGPNGAGKSTTIKMICGLLRPSKGSIEIFGNDIQKDRKSALRHISAVLEGNRNLYWRLTPLENMEYFAGIRGKMLKKAEAFEILKWLGIENKANDLVQQLSRGMQQKTALAVALASDAKFLLLDEPTLGLDVKSSVEFRKILRYLTEEYDKTILLSTHDMNLVEAVADRVAIMSQGKIIINEDKDKLLRVFKARGYKIRISLNGRNPEEYAAALEAREWDIKGNYAEFKLDLTSSDKLFSILEKLKILSAEIESIEQETVNFEKIFMKYVDGE
ncbi:ABC transporter ATP-binding protein [Kosmotoga pacifica]|uniref:ABC transporter n=1 Tax=Kosmotoga pacifica TaxID=1330330 RepID=A0A0G2ZB07_9BACT|nr:ABC transporter ATP-binding protein [Kosmotoga pacifica]AKI97286.1 ABC transporter [Kosmotoga pacifica]